MKLPPRGLLRTVVLIGAFATGSWASLRAPANPTPPVVANHTPGPALEPPAPAVDPTAIPAIGAFPRLNPEANMTKAWRLAEGPHPRAGDRRKLVTLTFDDGPFPETTPKVLELLDKYQVRATFFVVGRYLDGESDRARASRAVLQKVADAGHTIGNHTHDHELLTAISHMQVLEQIDRGASSIERATGKRPIFFRPPFGELDEFGQEAVSTRGLEVLLWNVEAQDMERDDSATMFRELVQQIHYNEGGVVLLHDIRWTSVNLLKRLLAYLDAKRWDKARPERAGYEIVDLPTYLRAVAASPPQPGGRPKKKRPQI